MNISRNVFSKTRISIQCFYCDRRINIVSRLRSFTKRIRQHCKIYNEIKYLNSGESNKININKIQNDNVDYFVTARFLIQELTQKSSFLSNHDLVLTFHYLTIIKKPLIKICSTKYIFSKDNYNSDLKLNIIEKDPNNREIISKLMYKCQKTLLNYLIESDLNKNLTSIQRYYLIIALQKECDLVTFKDWLQLYESVCHTLNSNLVNTYKTNEIANLLLIYDQISRYSYKRFRANDNKFNNIDIKINTDSHLTKYKGLTTQLLECKDISNTDEDNKLTKITTELRERREYDPFNLDFVNISIYRIQNCLDELTPEKIIKLLYLINSRRHYSNNFFQNSIIHFESNNTLNDLKAHQVLCLFNLYSNAHNNQTVKYIENFIQNTNLSDKYLLILDEIDKFDKIGNLNNHMRDIFRDSRNEFTLLDESKAMFSKIESLGLCTMILVLECATRISTFNPRIFSNTKDLSDKLSSNFEKEHEWKDIITFLQGRLANIQHLTTHNKSDGDSVIKLLNILNNLIKTNLILLKIFKTEQNSDRIKKIQFSIEFFTAVFSHVSSFIPLENFTIKSDLFDKNTIKKLNLDQLVDCNCI